MKISYNWIKEFIDIDLPAQKAADLLTDIGLEVEGYETIGVSKERLKGLVTGEVLETWKHPNADKLKVTRVNLGSHGEKQIVCGAPNVAAGQKVVVATIGTLIRLTDGNSFEIKKSKIRGEESEGMICAEDEIGLGINHDGIMVLPDSTLVGIDFADITETNEDVIFEIGLTPNRTDAYSHFGVARDLAAAIHSREQKSVKVKFPDSADLDFNLKENAGFTVEVLNGKACPRYAGVIVSNLKTGPSPDWLKNRLESIGAKPINNVVDVTNLVLHELGQPVHAFDMRNVGAGIVVQNVKTNTPFITLDGIERKLTDSDLMICNKEKPMCIGGVFGGLESGVKEDTTTVFLESACFGSESIRKTSLHHGLRTEAAIRFEKGVDPNITIKALMRAVKLLQEVAGGKQASKVFDIQSEVTDPHKVSLSLEKLRKYAGIEIPLERVISILVDLDIQLISKEEGVLNLEVAPYRVDVTRDVDVIEEVVRIYGINNLPIPEKLNTGLPSGENEKRFARIKRVADLLNGMGFSEILTNSITKSKHYNDKTSIIPLLNSLNAELDIMRPDMLITGLEVLQYNVNRKNNDLKLFELGKTYRKVGDNFEENAVISLYATGNQNPVNWKTPAKEIDFYYLKSVIFNLLNTLGLSSYKITEAEDSNMDFGLKIESGKKQIAGVYAVKKSVYSRFDIDKPVFFAEIFTENLNKILDKSVVRYQEITKFPGTRRDLSLLLDKSIKFQQIIDLSSAIGGMLLKHIDLFDVYVDERMGENKKSYAVSFHFLNELKTITDDEVETVMKTIIKELKEKLNADIR